MATETAKKKIEHCDAKAMDSKKQTAGSALWRWRYAILLVILATLFSALTYPKDGTIKSSAVCQFLSTNKNFKTYSAKEIGWLYNANSHTNATALFKEIWQSVNDSVPETEALSELLQGLPHLGRFCLLFIPGLFTEWYPGYMSSVLTELTNVGLDVRFIPLHTGSSVRANAKFIKDFVDRIVLHNPTVRFICVGHSKGVVDVTATITLYPKIRERIVALVSMQAPYAGATIVHDLAQTDIQRTIAFTLVEKLVPGSSFEAVSDLTYTSRRAFIKEHPFPSNSIPTISLATCVKSRLGDFVVTGLKPVIEYVHLRYNGTCSDGCVSQRDAVIPAKAQFSFTYLTSLSLVPITIGCIEPIAGDSRLCRGVSGRHGPLRPRLPAPALHRQLPPRQTRAGLAPSLAPGAWRYAGVRNAHGCSTLPVRDEVNVSIFYEVGMK